jgi:hypothetical protein
MAALTFVPSRNYIKGNIVYTPHPTDENTCYLWSRGGGRPNITEGFEMVRFVCSGCRTIKDKKVEWPPGTMPRSLKVNWTNQVWVDEPSKYPHVCQPRATEAEDGLKIRREELKNAAEGHSTNSAQSFKLISNRVRAELGNLPEERS